MVENSHAGFDGRYGCVATGIVQFEVSKTHEVPTDAIKRFVNHLLNDAYPKVSLNDYRC